MASPVKVTLKSGEVRYRGRVDVGRDPVSQRRRQVTITARTKREFADLASQARASIVDGRSATTAGSLTVARYLREHWFPHKVASGRASPATLHNYERWTEVHLVPGFGTVKLRALTTLQVQQWVTRLSGRLAPGTVRVILGVLDQALAQAVRWQLVTHNVCDGVTAPPASAPKRVPWSRAMVEAFLHASRDSDLHAAWCILARTGLRVGELLALTWNDVDLEVPVIRVRRTITDNRAGQQIVGSGPKTKHGLRDVLLDPETAAAIRALPRVALWLFPGQDGPRNADAVRVRLRNECRRLGFPEIRPHELRHAHGTHMMSVDTHPSVAMQRLGHGSMAMASRYIHPTIEHQRGVIERLAGEG